MSRGIQTGMVYFSLRIQPATAVIPYAQMLEQNDAIDFICMVDWLSSAWPQHVWPEDSLFATPGVGDSWHDTNVLLGMAAEAAPNLGLLNGTGCLRTGPAEHMRSFMTLASATNAEFIAAVGVGEACSTVPFGYNRSQGLAHLEDSFKLFNKLWECDGPFDFDGKVRKYQQAYIGTTRTHRPTILALGGGPRLLNIAAQYADGWCTWLPHIGKDPAIFAEWVQKLRNELENCGRDPESFRLASYFQVALHEDEDVIEHAFDADWLKFFAGAHGRVNGAAWRREGIEPPIPDDWSYSVKYLPNLATEAETKEFISRVTPQMVKEAHYYGSPAQVAEQLRPFADLGVEIFLPWDTLPGVMPLDEAPASVARHMELCRIIKTFKSKADG